MNWSSCQWIVTDDLQMRLAAAKFDQVQNKDRLTLSRDLNEMNQTLWLKSLLATKAAVMGMTRKASKRPANGGLPTNQDKK